jgi:hypothetical protein
MTLWTTSANCSFSTAFLSVTSIHLFAHSVKGAMFVGAAEERNSTRFYTKGDTSILIDDEKEISFFGNT